MPSPIGFHKIPYYRILIRLFLLEAQKSKNKAAGAGASGMITQIAQKNQMQLGSWKDLAFDLAIFDLSHVNEVLLNIIQNPFMES